VNQLAKLLSEWFAAEDATPRRKRLDRGLAMAYTPGEEKATLVISRPFPSKPSAAEVQTVVKAIREAAASRPDTLTQVEPGEVELVEARDGSSHHAIRIHLTWSAYKQASLID
jgi:hypothetical protein